MRDANEQLASSKEQIVAVQKKLEEVQKLKDQAERSKDETEKAKKKAEKAWDEAEQHGYNVGVVETKETFWAEVPAVCRTYCAQTWGETLNRGETLNWAGVEASSELLKFYNSLLQVFKFWIVIW